MNKILPIIVLLAFSVLSVELAIAGWNEGLAAFKAPWAAQVGLDLCISCFFAGMWIRNDAKKRGINPLPYLLLMPILGSISTLAYAVRRAVA